MGKKCFHSNQIRVSSGCMSYQILTGKCAEFGTFRWFDLIILIVLVQNHSNKLINRCVGMEFLMFHFIFFYHIELPIFFPHSALFQQIVFLSYCWMPFFGLREKIDPTVNKLTVSIILVIWNANVCACVRAHEESIIIENQIDEKSSDFSFLCSIFNDATLTTLEWNVDLPSTLNIYLYV